MSLIPNLDLIRSKIAAYKLLYPGLKEAQFNIEYVGSMVSLILEAQTLLEMDYLEMTKEKDAWLEKVRDF